MKQELWRRTEELFHAALEQAPEARTAFLDEACGEDTELRRQVALLVSKDEHAGSLLEKPLLADLTVALAARGSLVGRQFGPYSILSLLGAGGMGAVYRAHDSKLGRDVAMKTLPSEFARDPDRLARFRREARTLASLNHPNIGAIYGLEESGGVDCLVLELVEGDALHGPLPLAAALACASQVAEALEAAHERGIIHRDLKPANVKVTPQGRVKVLDFSLAKAIWGSEEKPDGSNTATLPGVETMTGRILGTPGYMSPEQASGKAVDQRTDVWAFGCLLYELLTGKRVFAGDTTPETIAAVLDREPDWQALPAGTPAKIRELLRQCLQKDPDRRLTHIADASRMIQEAQSRQASKRTAVPGLRVLTGRRMRVAAALVALAALLTVASNVGGWRDRLLRRPAVKSIQSLAVLPLENLSHDPEQDYFADGMTDEMITALAKIGALRVVSRTSVARYRGTKKPLPEIARELSVDAIVEGTVLRAQNRVRITAQLIRASPEEHLWAEQYEGNLEEVLTLQDTVAQDVARSIKINLTPRERTLLATPRAVDPTAYELYLKGRHLWELTGEQNLTKSRDYLEQAIEKDPGYALAWAGLADTYNHLADWGVLSSQDARPRARAAAEKALKLDSSLVGPLVTLADVKMNYEWDWAGVERLCEQAIALNPSYGNAHHAYATYLAEVGRTGEAVAEARRAYKVEPLSVEFGANVGWKLYYARQYQEAELEWRKLVALYPGFTGGYGLATLYLQTGRQREAIAEFQKDAAESHRAALQLMYLGHALGVSGARAEGQKVLEEMLSKRRYFPPEYIAIVYEGLGEREQALQWFEKAYAEHSMNGWILPDPQLDPIRAEPRFKEIMRRMGLPR